MLRGLLFDLDDTLYAYAPCNQAALDAVFEGIGRELWETPEAFRALHDDVRGQLAQELAGQAASHDRILFFKRMLERANGSPDPERAVAMYELYWERFLETMQPADRAHEVLERLARTYELALVSNHTTHAQLRKISRLGITAYFRAIVTSQEAGAEKPAARPFECALAKLEVAPTEALMIGDDPRSDMGGARSLGLRTIWTSEFRGGPVPACDGHIAELGELPDHPLLGPPS